MMQLKRHCIRSGTGYSEGSLGRYQYAIEISMLLGRIPTEVPAHRGEFFVDHFGETPTADYFRGTMSEDLEVKAFYWTGEDDEDPN